MTLFQKTKKPCYLFDNRASLKKVAVSYSPALHCSTIGAGGLNFSVRNGKRWFLTAITTAIYYLREQTIGSVAR